MLLYVMRRLLQIVPLLLFISALIFIAALFNAGGSALSDASRHPASAAEDYERLRKLYGFDDPVYIQYWKWLWQLIQLNPGYSTGVRPARLRYYLAGAEKHSRVDHCSGGHRQADRDSAGYLFRRAAILHR